MVETMELRDMHIGYVPYSNALTMPGDRRRFVNYARRRGLTFEIADPHRTYDVVILSERADISVWCDYAKGKVVYDLIDSYLAIPRTSMKGNLRGLAKFLTRQSKRLQLDYWRAIQRMCQRADAVVCTTEEQRRDILPFCDNVHIILDVHSMMTQSVKQQYTASLPFRLVCEGLPQTLGDLSLVADVLQRVGRQYRIELHVITDLEYSRYLGRYLRANTADLLHRIFPEAILHEWREESCARLICECDLAVIPLSMHDPAVAGKPENKLLLFWRMGMPALVSAIPAYVRAMQAAEVEMACANESQWEAMLMRCIEDEELRRSGGERGRRYAETRYSEERILAAWDGMIASLWKR